MDVRLMTLCAQRQARGAICSLVALVALLALAACSSAPTGVAQATPTPSPASSPTPLGPKPASIQGQIQWYAARAVGTAAKTITATYQAKDGSADVTILLVWHDAWKEHFSEAQQIAETTCYQAQAALWTSGLALSGVTVTVLGNTLDDYADPIVSAYAAATLSAASAKTIVWDSISPTQAWAKYDSVFLRPTYAPDWAYHEVP